MKMKLSVIVLQALAFVAAAQAPAAYNDPKSSITFQAFIDPSGYTFGISLPATPSSDFIGLLIGQGTGWAGISLGGAMRNKLLVAAWSNGTGIVSSFRRVGAYSSPPEITGSYTIFPISNGTYVNSTHYSLTFLCKSCIQTDGSTFLSNDTNAVLGWAMSGTAPASKMNHSSSLNYHSNYGTFAIEFGSARNSMFSFWAGFV